MPVDSLDLIKYLINRDKWNLKRLMRAGNALLFIFERLTEENQIIARPLFNFYIQILDREYHTQFEKSEFTKKDLTEMLSDESEREFLKLASGI